MLLRWIAGVFVFAALMHVPGSEAQGSSQQPVAAPFHAIDAFPLREDGPVLRQPVQTGVPFTVAGPQGVLVGEQQGVLEAWVLPVKLLSHLTIEANIEGYGVPIDMNSMAREIEVRPDHTTITYSHLGLTLRQTMFAPDSAADGTGAVVLFQADAVRPTELIFRFTPEMREMWPKPSLGTASPEWVKQSASGYYVLHMDSPSLAGAVALPGATEGVLAPYQERPQTHPLEFHLHIDPKTDRERIYPLLMAVGRTPETATNEALEAKLRGLEDGLATMYAAHAERYRAQEKARTSIVTPDEGLNAHFAWAETSIEQLRAKAQSSGELGLVAGYFASGESARPGFGWFFGRDALYTLYAVDSYGDFALSKTELEFLMRRQRADGKMMHEYSQTAADVDWAAYPYEYAAADATPLFLTTMLDYVRSSGDVAFLRAHRDAVLKAWQFETTHDSDGDGIYDNAQGTGWVESWPPGMPRQEIYLALLDEQASAAMAELGGMLGDAALASAAKARAGTVHATIEREYYRAETMTYAFSRNDGGAIDASDTVFPAIAWWNGGTGLEHPAASLRRWSSHVFATDWGLRDVAASDALYDSMSYHQGSVWPLFTGWQAMAEYRAGHTLAGYQSTMQNVDLTTAQDLGAVTELLSGDLFVPFGRSTSHQLWSSAMVVTPLMRGMFGIDVDGMAHMVRVTPRLPADWAGAEIKQLRVGDATIDLSYKREGRVMVVRVVGTGVKLVGAAGDGTVLRVTLPSVEVSLGHGLPLPGARTAQMKVLDEVKDGHSLRLELEAVAGTESMLLLRRNDPAAKVQVEGAEMVGGTLRVRFPAGSGYVAKTVTLRW